MSDTPTVNEPGTKLASVTNAAVTSDKLPEIATAFVIITFPVVLFTIDLRLLALTDALSASLIVISILLVVVPKATAPNLIPSVASFIASVTVLTLANEPKIELNVVALTNIGVEASITFKSKASALVPITVIV